MTGDQVGPAGATAASVYGAVRRAHPELGVVRVRKRVMTPLARALEQEIALRTRRPVLFAGFQTGRFLARSLPRWQRLATRARSAVVFADLEDEPVAADGLDVVALGPDAPLRMEWVIVCDDAEFSCVLSGWEVPGQHLARDVDRIFELVWSVEPEPVRVAARTCAAAAAAAGVPGAETVLADLAPAPVSEADLRTAWQVFTRVLAQVGGAPGEAEGLRHWGTAAGPRHEGTAEDRTAPA